jgi:carbonic anhydrase
MALKKSVKFRIAAALTLSLCAVPAGWAQNRPAAYGTGKQAKPAAAAAVVAEPKQDVPASDPLRQRLAERLSSSSEPIDKPKPKPVQRREGGETHKPAAHDVHWSYVGEGAPDRWGQLKPEYRQCAIGVRQSPIDIRETIKVDLEPIQIDYRLSSFSVVDNGHTVQVNVAPGNTIQLTGRRYELLQFHFHRPSEERVMGRQFEMSAHLVHKDAEGRLAVIGVLLDRGAEQPLVQMVWNNLPLEKNEPAPGVGLIDLQQLLPTDRSYYTYMGSLTTPPCSEGVLWLVMRQPVPVSQDQVNIFSRLYPMNARPLQAASGRLIKESR